MNASITNSNLTDDEFLDSICYLLECRGKADVASKLRTAYYRLGPDEEHREEPGLLRAESSSWETPDDGRSESALYSDGCGPLFSGELLSGVEEDDSDDLHRDSVLQRCP